MGLAVYNPPMGISNAEEAKQILDNNLYMTISVADKNGIPWIANLYFAYDSDLNLYWYSSGQTRHSKLIDQNPSIAIAIFDSTAIGADANAVYFEAEAHEIKDDESLDNGLKVFTQKMLETKFLPDDQAVGSFIQQKEDFLGNTVLHLYKAIPQKAYTLVEPEMVNDKYVDSRIEIPLTELQELAIRR